MTWLIPVAAAALVVVVVLYLSLKVIPEYERGVVFRAGRLRPLYGPGVKFLIPVVDRLIRVDQRVVTLTIPPQEVITKDNVPARVNAVVMFRVTDPLNAIVAVENYSVATSQIAQTTLRSLLGRADLDTLLAHRDDLNQDLRTIIEKQTCDWGVEVSVVEIKDVEIPESMQRAMAREAEAERERRAKVINAHGELQASDELRQAAETLSKSPASLQLRYLQTLLELGADQNSTVVFPLPVDIITPSCGAQVMSPAVWLLIALPLAGAVVLLLAGRRSDRWGHLLGTAAAVASFVVGVVLFAGMLGRPAEDRAVHETLFSWVPVGDLQVDFGLQLDQLSMCFVLLITGVGSLIHVYSIGYMAPGAQLAERPTDTGPSRRLFRLPQPVPGRDAAARPSRQLPRALRGLGGCRPGVVPADRLLVVQTVGGHRGEEGLRRQPRRRHGSGYRADDHVRHRRIGVVRRGVRRRTATRRGHAHRDRAAAAARRVR